MPRMPRSPRDPFSRAQREHRLGDAPIEARIARNMLRATRQVDAMLNPNQTGDERDWGFVMLVFPYGDRSGRCNFISNGADRRDVVNLMLEMVERFRSDDAEAQSGPPPAGFDRMSRGDGAGDVPGGAAEVSNAREPTGPGRTLAARWATVNAGLATEIPREIRETLRVVFYLGASELMDLVMGGLSDGDELTDADTAFMDALKAEMDRALHDIKHGG